MKKKNCKNRKCRDTSEDNDQSDSASTNEKSTKDMFLGNFVPVIATGLANSITYLIYGFVFWLVRKLFKPDLEMLKEVLSSFFYKKDNVSEYNACTV